MATTSIFAWSAQEPDEIMATVVTKVEMKSQHRFPNWPTKATAIFNTHCGSWWPIERVTYMCICAQEEVTAQDKNSLRKIIDMCIALVQLPLLLCHTSCTTFKFCANHAVMRWHDRSTAFKFFRQNFRTSSMDLRTTVTVISLLHFTFCQTTRADLFRFNVLIDFDNQHDPLARLLRQPAQKKANEWFRKEGTFSYLNQNQTSRKNRGNVLSQGARSLEARFVAYEK